MAKVGRKPLPAEQRKWKKASGYFSVTEFEEIKAAAAIMFPYNPSPMNQLVRRAVFRHIKDAGRSHAKKED